VDRDWALVDALRRRDSTAAERLLETFGDRVHRLALRITGNAQDAEEVVQDAFWSVLRHIDTFRGESLLGSWTYRITANTAYQKLRRAAHRGDEISLDQVLPIIDDGHHHGDPRDWSAQIADPAIQSELRDVLASAIDELPANHRAVLVLHDVAHDESHHVAGHVLVRCSCTQWLPSLAMEAYHFRIISFERTRHATFGRHRRGKSPQGLLQPQNRQHVHQGRTAHA
jgi:RNA polymerase sigma-70 factor (ECF subfamily)